MTWGCLVISPVLVAWVVRSSSAHIYKVYANTQTHFFFFRLRNMIYPGQGHGEDFPIQIRAFSHFFVSITLLYLSSDFTHFYHEQIGNFDTFIKVYRRFFFVVLHFSISDMLSFLRPSSYMLRIHASLSISHLSFLNMSLIRISYSFQSLAGKMKICLKQVPSVFWPSLFWKVQSVPASSGKLWVRGWQQTPAGESLPPEAVLQAEPSHWEGWSCSGYLSPR